MKRRCSVHRTMLGLLLVCGMERTTAAGESVEVAVYNEANDLYRNAQYAEAVEKYEQIVSMDVRSGDLFYNLGNSYFKLRRTGRAILWYERALRLFPRDRDIRANLRFANAVKMDKDLPENEYVLLRRILSLPHFFTVNELSVFCSTLLFLIAAVVIVWIFRKFHFPVLLIFSEIVLGLLLVLGVASLSANVYRDDGLRTAIVMDPEVNAMSGPSEDQTKVFVLHEGTKVWIERMEGAWVLIRLANGAGGWIRSETVEEVRG